MMQSDVASLCPVCRSPAHTPFTTLPSRFRVVVCPTCGLGRTLPPPPWDELRSLYVGDYATVHARKFAGFIERGRRAFVRALARRVARRAGTGGRVLDIGCGDGKLLAALAERGFDCTGTELNPRVREGLPAGLAVRVHTGGLVEAALPPASFQVIILRHVLEHLVDPIATLHEIRRIIAPAGTLVVAVPNLASWQARLTRDHWFHLDLPRHLYHFTPRALRRALAQTGFRTERMSHFAFEQNPYGWLQSGLNLVGNRWATLYDQLRTGQERRPDALVMSVALALMPACVLLGSVESLARAGGTIEAWARPA